MLCSQNCLSALGFYKWYHAIRLNTTKSFDVIYIFTYQTDLVEFSPIVVKIRTKANLQKQC